MSLGALTYIKSSRNDDLRGFGVIDTFKISLKTHKISIIIGSRSSEGIPHHSKMHSSETQTRCKLMVC